MGKPQTGSIGERIQDLHVPVADDFQPMVSAVQLKLAPNAVQLPPSRLWAVEATSGAHTIIIASMHHPELLGFTGVPGGTQSRGDPVRLCTIGRLLLVKGDCNQPGAIHSLPSDALNQDPPLHDAGRDSCASSAVTPPPARHPVPSSRNAQWGEPKPPDGNDRIYFWRPSCLTNAVVFTLLIVRSNRVTAAHAH